jgi:hypothetical protein
MGIRGAHVTVGGRGITKTVGIPGSGVFCTSRSAYHTGLHSAHREPPLNNERAARRHRKAKANFIMAAIVLALAMVIFTLSMMRPR